MIPGSNILSQALRVIAPQTVNYIQFLNRNLNDIGLWEAVYSGPQLIQGSFQPVPRNIYQQYGLDLQKNYAYFYTSTQILDIRRDVSCDQIQFQNAVYACESITAWHGIDGWVAVLCVEVTAEEFSKRFDDRFNNRFN